MFLIIDIYRLGVVYPYLSTSISLDECDYYRYISHIIINVINNDEEIYIAIYLPKKFPDEYAFKGDFSVRPESLILNSSLFPILRTHLSVSLLRFKETNWRLEW